LRQQSANKKLDMLKRILIAYDGSEPAERAFDFALSLSRAYQSELFVFAVARPPEPADDVETEAILEYAEEHFKLQFSDLERRASQHGVKAHFSTAVGHPVEQILFQAETNRIDHIVVGSRGKNMFQRLLLGSVSSQLVDHARCSVTVVR
jgi:nucleotide-binding universal stress UspA family protein